MTEKEKYDFYRNNRWCSAGKSAVLDYLKKLKGVRVMLSDEIAHELMEREATATTD